MSRHHAALSSRRWEAVRRIVFKRDGYRCVMCGKAGRLECDHINSMQREPGQDPYDPNGCQTLCRTCHLAKTADERRPALTPAQLEWRHLVRELSK